MSTKTIQLWMGLVLFLVGGGLLAFARDSRGLVGVGTTVGIVGLGLMAWSWFTRGSDDAA